MKFLSYYLPTAPFILVYMAQQVEYGPARFLGWLGRYPNLGRTMKRQKLAMTNKTILLLAVAYISWLSPISVALWLWSNGWLLLAFLLLATVPFVCIVTLAFVMLVARIFVVNPIESREVTRAKRKLDSNPATRIAVLGSYGKTTMKYLLQTVLSEGKQTNATPGNQNVLISHARWVNRSVGGREEVLIFEYGEARPGDIARLADFSQPEFAVITGLAPAHMEDYDSLDAIAADFADIWKYVGPEEIYTNAESLYSSFQQNGQNQYSINGIGNWKVSNISASLEGTSFTLKNGKRMLKLRTRLIGLHQIGPLCAVVDIADKLGLTDVQIQEGVAKTEPFEHRMKPYQLAGAWVIDDTYNGNIEGAKAGLKFLSELDAGGRKIYVTPGFVEQGDLKRTVHDELGRAIAKANPDRVVLMQNSTTEFIQAGLEAGNYKGELVIEGNPLDFYTNLEHFVAGGDVVLMQNDWTDNYL